MSYMPIHASQFRDALATIGFDSTVANREVVYEYALVDAPAFKVKVYTSLAVGEEWCREKGADAIRVAVTYTAPNGRTYGLGKATRVNRTGHPSSVIARMLKRTAEMYALAVKYSKVTPCHCGSPRWPDSLRCIAKCHLGAHP